VQLAGYRIAGILGEGGTSVVYRAVDARGTSLALKVLRADRSGLSGHRRFHREIVSMQALEHPSLPRMHGWGEVPGVGPYLAMELLEGEDLDRRVERTGPLPVDDVVRIGRAIAGALDAAHRAGLVHRDVKPGNVFLCRDGSVRLLDFGLALGVDPETARLTTADALLGTPAHIAFYQAVRTVGPGRAAVFTNLVPFMVLGLSWLLVGEPIDAKRAYEVGYVNKVVPIADLMPAALDYATRIAATAPLPSRALKRFVAEAMPKGPTEIAGIARAQTDTIFASADWEEGRKAFAEKRPPDYRGR